MTKILRIRPLDGMTLAETLDVLEKSIALARQGMPEGGQLVLTGTEEHHSGHQPRDRGKFVKRLSGVRRARCRVDAGETESAYTHLFEKTMKQLVNGQGDAEAISARLKDLLSRAYESMFEIGMKASGYPLVPQDLHLELVRRYAREQMDFVDGFVDAVKNGDGRLNYEDRAHMHGLQSRALYWLGWVIGNSDPARHIRWVMHPEKEHCQSCSAMASLGDVGEGVWTPRALLKTTLVPQSGRLDCKGYYCGCHLEESFVRGKHKEDGVVAEIVPWHETPRPLRWDGNQPGMAEADAHVGAPDD